MASGYQPHVFTPLHSARSAGHPAFAPPCPGRSSRPSSPGICPGCSRASLRSCHPDLTPSYRRAPWRPLPRRCRHLRFGIRASPLGCLVPTSWFLTTAPVSSAIRPVAGVSTIRRWQGVAGLLHPAADEGSPRFRSSAPGWLLTTPEPPSPRRFTPRSLPLVISSPGVTTRSCPPDVPSPCSRCLASIPVAGRGAQRPSPGERRLQGFAPIPRSVPSQGVSASTRPVLPWASSPFKVLLPVGPVSQVHRRSGTPLSRYLPNPAPYIQRTGPSLLPQLRFVSRSPRATTRF